MPTSFTPLVRVRLLSFAIDLAAAARIFTAGQLARHPELSWYRDPSLRAREFLAMHTEVFETVPAPYREPMRRRLTSREKRKRGLRYKSVSGTSQRSYHWLGLGDIWMQLAFNGGRPSEWKAEPDGQFDVYFKWRGKPYLLEYQRTPISQKQWRDKWKRRIEWYKAQTWQEYPTTVLVATANQEASTMCVPRGTVYVKSVDDLSRKLR